MSKLIRPGSVGKELESYALKVKSRRPLCSRWKGAGVYVPGLSSKAWVVGMLGVNVGGQAAPTSAWEKAEWGGRWG